MAFGPAWFIFQKTKGCKTTTISNQRKRTVDETMMLLYFSVLLVFAGGIHSTPVSGDFSFEVTGSQVHHEVVCAHFGSSAVISCKTNDPSANVSLIPPPKQSASSKNGIIIRNGQTFTIYGTTIHDGGRYQCVAESNGQVIKKYIFLLVAGIPNLVIIPPGPKRVLIGSKVSYICEADGLVCDKLQWSKDSGSMVGVTVTPPIRKNGTWRTDLVIEKADYSHSGDYKCELSYGQKKNEKVKTKVKIAVLGPSPVKIVTFSPARMTLRKSQDELVIKCRATGFPYPEITWKKDDKVIENCRLSEKCATSTRYLRTFNGLLIKRPRYPDDDGIFSCEAKNEFGDDKKDFDVIIPAAPVLSQSEKTTFVYNAQQFVPVEIPCVLKQGSPDPDFFWFFRVVSRKYKSSWHSVSMKKDKFVVEHDVGSSKSILKIVRSPFLNLNFQCKASNTVGHDEMEFKLRKSKN